MSLRASSTGNIPEMSFLEFLSTVTLGKFYVRAPHLFFPTGPGVEPDKGVSLALDMLGWTCEDFYGGTEGEAVAHLRHAAPHGPVMVGPVDMAHLTYTPGHEHMAGVDHYVVVVGVDEAHVRLHDPAGYPWVSLALSNFVEAWRAERVDYGLRPFRMRWNFRQAQAPTRREMIGRTVALIRERMAVDWSHPEFALGQAALCALAEDLRKGDFPEGSTSRLIWFALPLAAAHLSNAAAYLREGGFDGISDLALEAALLYGETLGHATQHQWEAVAAILERAAPVEHRLEMAIQSS
jgi:hypothetical protein